MRLASPDPATVIFETATLKPPKLKPSLLRQPVHFFALGFGSGLSPWAPGTCGSLVAIPLAWLAFELPWAGRLVLAIAAFAAGVWLCGESARRLNCHDHPGIVWDEIAAMLLLTLVIPKHFGWLMMGFALFRVFDILKPWPIRDLDHRLHGGVGIMLDDSVAALYTVACLWLIQNLLQAI